MKQLRKNSKNKKGLSKNALKDVCDAVTMTQEESKKSYKQYVKLRDTTIKALLKYGIEDLPMMERTSHVRENILTEMEAINLGYSIKGKHYHGLGVKKYLEIIESLDNPIGIYQYMDDSNNYIVLTSIKVQSSPVIVPIEINNRGIYNYIFIKFNRIKSIYYKENNMYFENQVKIGKMKKLY